MQNKQEKCECGSKLIPSQYARKKKESEPSKKYEEDLVCSNPKCNNSEKNNNLNID